MSTVKITVQWRESRDIEIDPRDIADRLDVEADDSTVSLAILSDIDAEVDSDPPRYSITGREDLAAAIRALLDKRKADWAADEEVE
mgnify:FL=1